MKMRGSNHTLSCIQTFVPRRKTSLRKIFSNSWTTASLARRWKIFETERIFDWSITKSHWKNVRQNQTLIISLNLTKILLQCIWKKRNWFSINQSISEWVSWICQRPWCMIFIIIASRKNSARRQICCSQTLTVFAMKAKEKISTKIFQMMSKKNLTLQISH